MAADQKNPDIIIHGAGIAGLWIFHRLKSIGYDVLLLEKEAIGSGQTLASQGIIHSGLKYAIAGQINELAKSISQMPDRWRAALNGQGEIDLSSVQSAISSQYMMIPKGFMGGLIKLASQKALGGNVYEVPEDKWPKNVADSGFKGTLIHMDEPVLDIAQIIRGLAEPYRDCIRKNDNSKTKAKLHIYTAAAGNHEIAKVNGHDKNLETQARPLLMGMMKPAPFELNAHLIGASEKPIATITTHTDKNGGLVWYLGGAVAERKKEANPQDVYGEIKKALTKYMPDIDLSQIQWATLPIDRIEGKSGAKGWLPDTPTIHAVNNHIYAWPTKLTFAPMLCDMILERLKEQNIEPSHNQTEFSDLPELDYAQTPWDKASWTNDN